MHGVAQLLTAVRNDALNKPHATHGQYYQYLVTRAMLDGLTQRIDTRLSQIREKGTS